LLHGKAPFCAETVIGGTVLRGFRWQLLVLVMALGLFVVSLLTRLTTPEQPVPEATNQNVPTVELAPPTSTPQNLEVLPAAEINVGQSMPIYREALVGNLQRLNPLLSGLNPVDRDITSLIF
jgi:hypothetical protein